MAVPWFFPMLSLAGASPDLAGDVPVTFLATSLTVSETPLSIRLGLIVLAVLVDALLCNRKLVNRITSPDSLFYGALHWLSGRLNRAERSPVTRFVRGLLLLVIFIPAAYWVGSLLDEVLLGPTVGLAGGALALMIAILCFGQRASWDLANDIAQAVNMTNNRAQTAYPRPDLPQNGGIADAQRRDPFHTGRLTVERMALRFSDGLITNALLFALGGFALLLAYRLAAMQVAIAVPTGLARPDSPYFMPAVILQESIGMIGSLVGSAFLILALLFIPGTSAARAVRAFGTAVTARTSGYRPDHACLYSRRLPLTVMAYGLGLSFQIATGAGSDSAAKGLDNWIGDETARARLTAADIRRAIAVAFTANLLALLALVAAMAALLTP
ncbi:cobalamin biosynthesis protein [Eilatimonas milleporae]|uniref:Cobalamin biosynthesis protein CobD/CbiB n=1 Tax=Eilatimonas milleporae TaxID=911205 RepID=A0A3M0CHZ6_9PROT|nr:cobalamin biosynthesis protein [Eilatimonas milleporae]RMB02863.1 cobalamin biosynthesis protein CobD/CbiB [Eilatimonas milleporae]